MLLEISRRFWLKLTAAAGATLLAGSRKAAARGAVTAFGGGYRPGTIVVVTRDRTLFYVLGGGQAIRYPVGVGRAGMAWSGRAQIAEKYLKPAWGPPADIAVANPSIPLSIPGGSPRNPMGVAAMTLAGGEYAIHGTNVPGSVGGFVSYGCIRMLNDDISDLYQRVPVGTTVMVTR